MDLNQKERSFQTHDAFFKKSMSRPEVSREFFDAHLPAYIKDKVDLSTLKIEQETLQDNALGKGIVDMLFSAKFSSGMGYIYLLSEHQSKSDYWMPFRIWKYMLGICSMHRKKHPKSKKLPIVYPLIFYSGKSKYNKPLALWELFDQSEIMQKTFTQSFQLIEVKNIPEDDLPKRLFLWGMEYIMKHIHEPDILSYIASAKELFKEISENNSDYLIDILCYSIERGDSENEGATRQIFEEIATEENIGNVMTIAERLMTRARNEGIQFGIERGRNEGIQFGIEQGMERGRNEGIEEGMERVALNMLNKGQDIKFISEITGLSVKKIQSLRNSNSILIN